MSPSPYCLYMWINCYFLGRLHRLLYCIAQLKLHSTKGVHHLNYLRLVANTSVNSNWHHTNKHLTDPMLYDNTVSNCKRPNMCTIYFPWAVCGKAQQISGIFCIRHWIRRIHWNAYEQLFGQSIQSNVLPKYHVYCFGEEIHSSVVNEHYFLKS